MVVRDLEAGLRLYRNGLGLDLVDVAQQVHRFKGAALRRVHAAPRRTPVYTVDTATSPSRYPAGFNWRPCAVGKLHAPRRLFRRLEGFMKARAHDMHPLAERVGLVECDNQARTPEVRAMTPGHAPEGHADPGNAGTSAEGDEDK